MTFDEGIKLTHEKMYLPLLTTYQRRSLQVCRATFLFKDCDESSTMPQCYQKTFNEGNTAPIEELILPLSIHVAWSLPPDVLDVLWTCALSPCLHPGKLSPPQSPLVVPELSHLRKFSG